MSKFQWGVFYLLFTLYTNIEMVKKEKKIGSSKSLFFHHCRSGMVWDDLYYVLQLFLLHWLVDTVTKIYSKKLVLIID